MAHLNGEPVRGAGGIVPMDPLKAMEEGAGADIDMLTGTVADEWRYWLPEMERSTKEENIEAYYEFMKLLSDRISGSGLITKVDPRFDVKGFMDIVQTESDELDAKYPNIWKYTEINNEKVFRMPSINQAEAHVKAGGKGKTYMYIFGKHSAKDPSLGACHSVELPYVFLNPYAVTITGKVDMELARKVSRIWTNFARTGNPSIDGIDWPEYDLANRATLIIGNDNSFKVVNDPKREQREFVQEAMRKAQKAGK